MLLTIQSQSFLSLDAVTFIRSSFLSAITAVLLVSIIPVLRERFLAYGARSTTFSSSTAKQEKLEQLNAVRAKASLLDYVKSWQVPHSWFISFYITSASLSVFWLLALSLFRRTLLADNAYIDLSRPAPTFSRQQLSMVLLLIQGLRRLFECHMFSTGSSATMWIGHWLMGMAFYVGMSVAIWIEGAPELLRHQFSIHDVEIQPPSLRSFCSLMLFIFASGAQHDCHAYLASLRRSAGSKSTYQVPTHPAFNATLTPHYLAECLIYLSLALLAAPEGQWLNMTLLSATIFVTVNLGITAVGTREWYAETFGKEAVKGRWAMIPLIL